MAHYSVAAAGNKNILSCWAITLRLFAGNVLAERTAEIEENYVIIIALIFFRMRWEGGGEFDTGKSERGAGDWSFFFSPVLCAKKWDCGEPSGSAIFLLSIPDRTAAPDTICQAI